MPVGAALGSAAITGGSQLWAGSQANKSSNQALAYQQQIRGDVQPWVQGGINAYNNLSNPNQLMKNFYTSPNYQFTMQQGLNAVGTDNAVNGLLKSGGALKGLTNYASNLAAGQFNNYVGQQQYLSSAGLNAEGLAAGSANQSSNIAQNNGVNQGNMDLSMGNTLNTLLGKLTANYPPPGGGSGTTTSYVTGGSGSG